SAKSRSPPPGSSSRCSSTSAGAPRKWPRGPICSSRCGGRTGSVTPTSSTCTCRTCVASSTPSLPTCGSCTPCAVSASGSATNCFGEALSDEAVSEDLSAWRAAPSGVGGEDRPALLLDPDEVGDTTIGDHLQARQPA